ncbi:DUF4250 domain-containing protein [Puniceicoccaceae bacterium K14]|nr:DUF4250 domain-containing protein [Puniceicoccaceae bacterium K14]
MDPHLLVGVINTTLRNHCESLDDLCASYDVEKNILIERLASAGYEYNVDEKRFV